MKEINSEFLNKLESDNYKINLKQLIDWDNDGVFDVDEDISDYILSGNISKKLEGNLGVNVVDTATITVDNSKQNFSPKNLSGKWSGNVIPNSYSEIKAGTNEYDMLLFDGYIQDIKPNYNNTKASIKLKDAISFLQNEDCPDKFYYNYRREEIIKDFLDRANINYTSNSIDTTVTEISDTFEGMKMWDAIQKIANSVWADVYIENGIFYFKTRLSPDYNGERAVDYNFSTDNINYDENIFKVEEEYTSRDLYNEVKIISKPLIEQKRQAIWTGAKEETEIQEEYNGSDILWNNDTQQYELQLTYVPESETTEQPTKNVPIVQGSFSLYDINTDTNYTIGNGISSIDYNTGIIAFEYTNGNLPIDSLNNLRVKYQYYFNKLSPNGLRHFYINLDNPAANIEDLNILAKDSYGNELTVSHFNWNIDNYNDPTADILIKQEVLSNQKQIKVNIINQTSLKVTLYGYLKDKEDTKNTPILMGKPFKRTNIMEITEVDQQSIDTYGKYKMPDVRIDYIASEKELKKLAQYLLYQYSTPKSKLKVNIKPLPHLELMDKVYINQKNRDIDNEFFIKEIKDIFKKNGTWEMELNLEQAQASDWDYVEKGTPVLGGKTTTDSDNYTPPADISGTNLALINASINGNNQVKVSWNKNLSSDLNHYNIYRREENESTFSFMKSIKKGTLYWIDTSVEYNKTYYYLVTAIDNSDNESDPSNAIVQNILIRQSNTPAVPLFTNSTTFDNEINLTWENIDEATEYEVRLDTNFGVIDSNCIYKGAETNFAFKNPTQRNYTFYIKSINNNERYSSDYTSITLTNEIPSQPPAPQITPFTEALWIKVEGVADDDIKGYRVYVDNITDGTSEHFDIPTPQRITYKAEGNKDFEVSVSAFDSIGEGAKSSVVSTNTKLIDYEDLPDGMLDETKLTDTLTSKINTSKSNSDAYASQVIGYPTEEEETNLTTADYLLKYTSGDVYTGTEIETDPNGFFDITDINDNDVFDINGVPITIVDIRDELGNTLLGTNEPVWYGGGSGEEVHLILSDLPYDSNGNRIYHVRFLYAVKKLLSQLSKDALLKRGVTAKQVDANLVDVISNLKGIPWNESLPADKQLINVESRVSTAEGNISSNQTSISSNADEISSVASRVTTNEGDISANQTSITQNADEITSVATRVTTNEGNISTHSSQLQQLADEYTVKIQEHANGQDVATGFGLSLDAGVSEFAILADRFRIFGDLTNTSETGQPVFALDTNDNKVYILGDLIADGTITARMIETGTITSDKINSIDADITNISAGNGNVTINDTGITISDSGMLTIGGSPASSQDYANQQANTAESNAKSYANPTKPQGAHLWHFDRSLVSTDGVKPTGTPVATLRPNEGKYSGGVALDYQTTNILSSSTSQAESGGNYLSYFNTPILFTNDIEPYQGDICIKLDTSGTTDGYPAGIMCKVSTTSPTFYTASAYIWSPVNIEIICGIYFNDGANHEGSHKHYTVPAKTWTRVESSTVDLTSQTSLGWASVLIRTENNANDLPLYVDAPQLQQQRFANSWVNGTRNHSILTYNTNISNPSSGVFRYYAPFEIRCTNANTPGNAISNTNMFELYDTSSNDYLQLETYQDKPFIDTQIGGADIGHYHNNWIPQADTWYFIHWELNGDTFKIKVYDDGNFNLIKEWSITNSGISNFSPNRFRLGNFGGSAIYDELLISPKAHTAEEIKSWYNSNAPFYDAEPVQSAGNITMTPEGMKIEGTDGIEIIGKDGDRAVLNDDLLAFYYAGSTTPRWYTKNVAYGVANDGDYIELNWKKKPKVQTAIRSLMSYNSDYSGSNQVYESDYSGVTKDGFYVTGKSIIKGNSVQFDSGNSRIRNGQTYITNETTRDIITKIESALDVYIHTDSYMTGTTYDWNVDVYYRRSDNSWTHYATSNGSSSEAVNGDRQLEGFNINVDNLNPSPDYGYQFKVVASFYHKYLSNSTVDMYAVFHPCYSYGNTIIDNGEVMWIAVEGGAD